MDMFGQALGFSLGVVPAALAFWGGLIDVLCHQDRRDERDREMRYHVMSRLDSLERRADELAPQRVG